MDNEKVLREAATRVLKCEKLEGQNAYKVDADDMEKLSAALSSVPAAPKDEDVFAAAEFAGADLQVMKARLSTPAQDKP